MEDSSEWQTEKKGAKDLKKELKAAMKRLDKQRKLAEWSKAKAKKLEEEYVVRRGCLGGALSARSM
jgi:hypothetical protein